MVLSIPSNNLNKGTRECRDVDRTFLTVLKLQSHKSLNVFYNDMKFYGLLQLDFFWDFSNKGKEEGSFNFNCEKSHF